MVSIEETLATATGAHMEPLPHGPKDVRLITQLNRLRSEPVCRAYVLHGECWLQKEQREHEGGQGTSGSWCRYAHPPGAELCEFRAQVEALRAENALRAQRIRVLTRDTERPQCKHWLLKRRCCLGDACKFHHASEQERIELERLSAAAAGGSADPALSLPLRQIERRPCGRKLVRNLHRATALRYWLIQWLGRERLRSGSGVVDVAGGKGELGFELVNLNRIGTTVVDPRVPNVGRYVRKWNRNHYHNPSVSSLREELNDEPRVEGRQPVAPANVRVFFGPWLYDAHTDASTRERDYYASVAEATMIEWTAQGLSRHESAPALPSRAELLARPDVTDFHSACELVADASVLVGLHPDQAAGAIIDAAILLRKPFAVLPCCTYSKEFPDRRTPSGEHVKSYEQLVPYLQAKHAAIQATTLPFEGRNVLLFADFR
ncbi:hypothetical protein FVE85_7891 [Porphyridium purpureum]|uniref:C3H1-type domain-containing protein n=1 Tax=Porphyridium purpureum TaxID=35688 RepID=A0A5J4YNX8_PORPP|nr:hypothetical protein FVE85_7891 [Porphyridium purpureum]|eukprot:POR7240..scf295_9